MRLNERAMRGAAASHEGATPCTYVEYKVAQPSASWLSGGLFQRQIVPQAAPSFGQSRLAGHTGLVFHKAVHDPRWEEQQLARARVVHEAVGGKRRPHTTRVVEGDWPR